MSFQLILDLLIIVLLVPTIVYAMILNRRLDTLRRSRNELVKFVEAFNQATARAESGIPRLRQAAEDAGVQLKEQVEKAHTLRDDLAFMVERADSMANRLEEGVRAARGEVRTASAAGGSASGPSLRLDGVSTSSSLGLSLRGDGERSPRPAPKSAPVAPPSAASLPAAEPAPAPSAPRGRGEPPQGRGGVLSAALFSGNGVLAGRMQGMGGGSASGENGEDEDFSIDDERSEAERELLRALQAAR